MRYIRVNVPTEVVESEETIVLIVDTEATVPTAIARVPVASVDTILDALNAE